MSFVESTLENTPLHKGAYKRVRYRFEHRVNGYVHETQGKEVKDTFNHKADAAAQALTLEDTLKDEELFSVLHLSDPDDHPRPVQPVDFTEALNALIWNTVDEVNEALAKKLSNACHDNEVDRVLALRLFRGSHSNNEFRAWWGTTNPQTSFALGDIDDLYQAHDELDELEVPYWPEVDAKASRL